MTRYELTYALTSEMRELAMASLAKSMRSPAENRRGLAFAALACVMGVALVIKLMDFGFINTTMIYSAFFGFCAGVGYWTLAYRSNMAKLSKLASVSVERQGDVRAEFCAEHIVFQTDLSSCHMQWSSLDHIYIVAGATVLRVGTFVYPIPDAALPKEITLDMFRADLTNWMEASR